MSKLTQLIPRRPIYQVNKFVNFDLISLSRKMQTIWILKYWDQDRLPKNLFCDLYFKLFPNLDLTDAIVKPNLKKATFPDLVLIYHIVDTFELDIVSSSYFEARSHKTDNKISTQILSWIGRRNGLDVGASIIICNSSFLCVLYILYTLYPMSPSGWYEAGVRTVCSSSLSEPRGEKQL